MSKTKITVVSIGHLPAEFDKRKILNWKSETFSIVDNIESYSLREDSDKEDWTYSDDIFEKALPKEFNGDFLIAISNVPLDQNWYTRRINNNRIVFTFYETKDILNSSDIPIENIILRMLYAYTLIFKRSGSKVPLNSEPTNFTHDETRGCIFDMNGIKTDIVHSCHNPIICSDCVERLKRENISNDLIITIKNEIRKIKKPLFQRIIFFVKKHPIWSLIISAISAVVLGAIGSIIGMLIYESLM